MPADRATGGRRCQAEGCGAMIWWVDTARGRRHPVNGEEPETYYLLHDEPGHPQVRVIMQGTGELIGGRQADAHTSGALKVVGWESHFASCPGAAQFSARRP